MPKKFTGENTKAAVAKARKQAAREMEGAKRKQELEEVLWKEDDKNVLRKQQRKEEKERKKQEQQDKKAENKALLEEDLKGLKLESKSPATKVTQARIQNELEKKKLTPNRLAKMETHLGSPLEENINRMPIEGEVAQTVSEAILVLSNKEPSIDKHPERRLKAAFLAYEEANMPRLKTENPTLRLSQVKQLLRKEWMKSSSNPVNQLHY